LIFSIKLTRPPTPSQEGNYLIPLNYETPLLPLPPDKGGWVGILPPDKGGWGVEKIGGIGKLTIISNHP